MTRKYFYRKGWDRRPLMIRQTTVMSMQKNVYRIFTLVFHKLETLTEKK